MSYGGFKAGLAGLRRVYLLLAQLAHIWPN